MAWLREVWAEATRRASLPYPHEWEDAPPLEVDDEGWLVGEGVTRIVSHPSWHYPRLTSPGGEPLAIVAHNTATKPGTGLAMARRRTRKFGLDPDDREASWHVSIEHADGAIIQQVSFRAGCWHAGSTTAKQIPGAGWANRVAASIELVGNDSTVGTPAQDLAAARVWRALVRRYEIPRERAMVPHSWIDPVRKTDPGKRWMSGHAPQVLAYAFAP